MYSREPYSLEEYQARLSSVSSMIFVAEENSELIADSIAFEKDGAWYIWILGVHTDHRRKGIADHLFEMNESYAKSHGHSKVVIKIYAVSSATQELAAKRGYCTVETGGEKDEKFLIVELFL